MKLSEYQDLVIECNKVGENFYSVNDRLPPDVLIWAIKTKSETRGVDTDWATDYYDIGVQDNEFVALDKFLELVSPDIPFLKYKKLLRTVEHITVSDDDYYYRTEYDVKYLELHDVLKFLEIEPENG